MLNNKASIKIIRDNNEVEIKCKSFTSQVSEGNLIIDFELDESNKKLNSFYLPNRKLQKRKCKKISWSRSIQKYHSIRSIHFWTPWFSKEDLTVEYIPTEKDEEAVIYFSLKGKEYIFDPILISKDKFVGIISSFTTWDLITDFLGNSNLGKSTDVYTIKLISYKKYEGYITENDFEGYITEIQLSNFAGRVQLIKRCAHKENDFITTH